MHSEGGSLVCLSLCLLPRFLPPSTTRQKIAIPKGSALHWLDFGEFCKGAAFERYGVKT